MALPESSQRELGDGFRICCLPIGLWQLSGGHGLIDRNEATEFFT